MRCALLGGILVGLVLATPACWFGHDYAECASDGDCHATQRCSSSVCVFRAGVARCFAGSACPGGLVCDEALFVCVAPRDAGSDGDGGDEGEDTGQGDARDAAADSRADSLLPDGDGGDLPLTGDLALDTDDPRDGGTADCGTGAECDLGGPPECRLGDPPEVVDDGWACTFDGCDERGRIFHTPSSALCAVAGPCERGSCDPSGQNSDDGSGCRVDVLPRGASCGVDRVCRDRECVAAGCGNEVVEIERGEECEVALVGVERCETCRWVPSTFDLATAPAPLTRIAGATGDRLRVVACSDLDADGADDLVLTSGSAGRVDLFFGPVGAGELGVADRSGRLRADQPLDVVIGRVRGAADDGGISLVARRADGGLYLYAAPDLRGVDWLVEGETARATVGIGRESVAAMGIADADGDGDDDVLVSFATGAGGRVVAYGWTPAGALEALPGDLLGGRFVSREFGVGGAVAYGAPGGGYWLSDPSEQLSPIDETTLGATYRLAAAWRPGRVGGVATLRVAGSRPGAGVRAAAVLGAPREGEEAVVFVEPGSRVYVAAESALIADFNLSDDPAAGLGVWIAETAGVSGVFAVDVTLDGERDLVMVDAGASLGRGARPGRLRVVPWPLALGRTVDLDAEPAPFEVLGGDGHALSAAVSCDIDGDGEPELGVILEEASDGAGEVRFYDVPSWTPRE